MDVVGIVLVGHHNNVDAVVEASLPEFQALIAMFVKGRSSNNNWNGNTDGGISGSDRSHAQLMPSNSTPRDDFCRNNSQVMHKIYISQCFRNLVLFKEPNHMEIYAST